MDDDLFTDTTDALPDVTARWIGRITQVDGDSLTISITPREDRQADPVIREFDRRHFTGRRKPRVGMHVAISEFDDGYILIEPITHWWSQPFIDLADVALMAGLFLVGIFS